MEIITQSERVRMEIITQSERGRKEIIRLVEEYLFWVLAHHTN